MFELRRLVVGVLCGLLLSLGTVALAQDGVATLEIGQPVSLQLGRPGDTLEVAYAVAAPSLITLQALGLDVAPTIAILSDGETVAGDVNGEAAPTLKLSTLLDAGEYVIQVGSVDDARGTVVLLLEDVAPGGVTPLDLGAVVAADVSADAPLAIYDFGAGSESLYLFVVTGWPEQGPSIQLVNVESGQVSAAFAGDIASGFLRIPAGSAHYQLKVAFSGMDEAEPFRLCVTTITAGGCENIGDQVVSGESPEAEQPAAAEPSGIDYLTMTYTRADDGGYVIGDPDAPITIVYFSDYACPHCQTYEPTIVRLIQDYVVTGQAQLEYRIFPTAGGQQTVFAGGIADCMSDYHASAFWIARERFAQLAQTGDYADAPRILADELGIPYDDLLECQAESTRVQLDMALGQQVGVTGTPAVLVRNGDSAPEYITQDDVLYNRGGVPFDVLSAVIEAAQAEE